MCLKEVYKEKTFGVSKHFQPECQSLPVLGLSSSILPCPLPCMAFPPLPCVFPSHIKTFRSRAMWIISQFSSWATHQKQTQTTRPDQKKFSCVRQKTPTSGGFNAPTVHAVHFLCPELLCLPALVSQVSIPCCQLIITEAAGSRVGTS